MDIVGRQMHRPAPKNQAIALIFQVDGRRSSNVFWEMPINAGRYPVVTKIILVRTTYYAIAESDASTRVTMGDGGITLPISAPLDGKLGTGSPTLQIAPTQ